MRATTAVASVLFAFAMCTRPAIAQDESKMPARAPGQTLDAFIGQEMEDAGIAGMAAAIILDGKVAWTQGYGFADKQHAVPFTPHSVINIGSISKTVTGVAMMQAVEAGKLSLDEDISAYLPFKVVNPHRPGSKITLRQLATHTSSLTDRWAVYRATYHFGGDATEPLDDFLRSYLVPGGSRYSPDNFLDAAPGTQRDYSNIGAGLAGYIVERVVGQKLNTYTRQKIFEPLDMRDSGWLLSEIAPEKLSKLYLSQYGLTIPIPFYGGTTYPDGGVRTSVADLSVFFSALLGDGSHEGARILQPQSVAEMTRFQFTPTHKPDNVELKEKNSGLFWQSKFDVTRMGHGGSDPGISTEMLSSLSKDIGVIVFANTSVADEDRKHSVAIFLEIWEQAEALKAARRGK